MKRLLINAIAFIMLMMAISVYTCGQITLDHTYTGWASVADLSVSGYKYHVLDTQAKTLKLYNADHSLWKTVNLSVPAGYTLMTAVYNVSENLFSLDGKVGFSYSYYTTTPDYQAETKVINENGTVLLTIAGANYAYAYDMDGESKLLAYIINYSTSTYTTKVYDLPGDFATGIAGIPQEQLLPYPNPATQAITIPYSANEMTYGGEIRVFNSGGQLMKSFQVDQSFDHIIIQPGMLSSGVYHYKILNSTGELDAGSFVVK